MASAKDIEMGMMMGAGVLPGPVHPRRRGRPRHDRSSGSRRPRRSGARPSRRPTILRRLVAQGRLGKKSGQGFFPYPQPDAGDQRETVLLETRGDVAIAWLNRPLANPLSPQAMRDLIAHLGVGRGQGPGARDRLLEHLHVQRRRGHQGVHEDERRRRGRGAGGVRSPLHARRWSSPRRSRSPPSTRSPSAAAASWRWPATSASPPSRPASGSRRSTWGSSPASAAPSACPGWWARRRRWR